MGFDGRILDRDEIDTLSRRALDGCGESLSRLIEGHLRMFYKAAQKYKQIISPDEAVSIMVENVIEKFHAKFKPNRGNFTKYAKWYAFAGIQWYLTFRHRVVQFPTREDYLIVSTNQSGEIEDDDRAYDDAGAVEMEEHRQYIINAIRGRIRDLPPIEREIVRLRFGIGTYGRDNPRMSYKAIGEEVGLSNEWARQILKRAIKKLAPYLDEFK